MKTKKSIHKTAIFNALGLKNKKVGSSYTGF